MTGTWSLNSLTLTDSYVLCGMKPSWRELDIMTWSKLSQSASATGRGQLRNVVWWSRHGSQNNPATFIPLTFFVSLTCTQKHIIQSCLTRIQDKKDFPKPSERRWLFHHRWVTRDSQPWSNGRETGVERHKRTETHPNRTDGLNGSRQGGFCRGGGGGWKEERRIKRKNGTESTGRHRACHSR